MFRSSLGRLLKMSSAVEIQMAKCSTLPTYKTLALTTPRPFVVHVELNRPDKSNAMNRDMYLEIGQCFNELAENPDCRVVVLSGAGPKLFSGGIDLFGMLTVGEEVASHDDIARKNMVFYKIIKRYQESLTALEKCPKPVLAAVHGACIGGAVEVVCAADMRYCSDDAWFTMKEVDLGMAADVGALQRLPRILGSHSLVNELLFTGRKYLAKEAKETGFVSRTYPDKESLLEGVLEIAASIAIKSPVGVQSTKRNIIFSKDNSLEAGQEFIALNNMSMLQSEDFVNAASAAATRSDPPTFSKL